MSLLDYLYSLKKVFINKSLYLDSQNVSDLRKFPEEDLVKFPLATENSFLCSGCRKKVKNYVVESSTESSQSQPSTPISSASDYDDTVDKLLKIKSPAKRKRYVL